MSSSTALRHKMFTGFELKSGAEGTFRARFATFAPAVDKDGDVTLPNAFEVGKRVLVSAYGHTSWSGALPVGDGVIGANDSKAWIDGRFWLNTIAGRDHYEVVKAAGPLQEYSYGFGINSASVDPSELSRYPGARRILKEVDVVEVSAVLVGAGVDTGTEWVKGARPIAAGRSATLEETHAQLQLETLVNEFELTKKKIAALDECVFMELEDADDVPLATRRLAKSTVELAARDLGIREPRISWFEPEPYSARKYREQYGSEWRSFTAHRHLRGKARPGGTEIWLRADLVGVALVEVAAHEVKHISQQANFCTADDLVEAESSMHEADALLYGHSIRDQVAQLYGR